MYHLHVLGVPVDSLAAAIGAIRNIPELCTLAYEPTFDPPAVEQREYYGPLLEAKDGYYHLWVGRPTEPLLITPGKVLLGSRLLIQGDTRARGRPSLDERARVTFSALLARSERVLYVYQQAMTGHQKYLLLWPDQKAPTLYDDDQEYPLLGKANLETGEVTQ